jgi:hypothetical protein
MNDPTQTAASAGARTQSNSVQKKTHAPKYLPSRGLAPMLMMAAGGLLTSIVVSAGMLAIPTGQEARLGSVPKDQLEDAIVSLTGQAAATTLTEIRECKVPLAFVAVSAEAGAAASTIRLRSGSYLTPPLPNAEGNCLLPARARQAKSGGRRPHSLLDSHSAGSRMHGRSPVHAGDA